MHFNDDCAIAYLVFKGVFDRISFVEANYGVLASQFLLPFCHVPFRRRSGTIVSGSWPTTLQTDKAK